MADQLQVSALYVYPIKSLGGMAVDSAAITDRGFRFDRRWMLVDAAYRFMSQREFPSMALLQATVAGDQLQVSHKVTGEQVHIPLLSSITENVMVTVWNDTCSAQTVSPVADQWFSRILGTSCKLVRMPDDSRRKVNAAYAPGGEITSFSDAFPFLLIGQSSLNDLNSRLQQALPMNRFRPNIVFTGGEPYGEDSLWHFTINHIDFFGVKPCSRCAITTTSQEDAGRGREPLRTLATYRALNNNIYFGQNLLHRGEGAIATGDRIMVKERRTLIQFS